MKKLRIGIFGMSRGYDYIDGILGSGADIVAICDRDEKKLEVAKEHIGREVALYTDFDSFIEHPIDAVILTNLFNEHAPYAIRCLERNIHVFSECISNATMAEGVQLVRAAEKSSAFYMLAENYPYMLFNREMKRVCDGGTLGKVMYAEGEYNHPTGPEDTWFIRTYIPYPNHWRNFLPRTYYVTHSLAPIMYMTGAVPKRVCALPIYFPLSDEYSTMSHVGDRTAIITTLNDDGSVFRFTGCAEFGAHENSYRVCAENGQIENVRGMGNKILLRYNPWSVPEGMTADNLYEPEWAENEKFLADKHAHGAADYLVVQEFINCIREGRKPDFDVYFSTTMSSVAILGHRSLLEKGVPYDIPDFRLEEDRLKYENDTLSPFPDENGVRTLPCCSNPDYAPSPAQTEKFFKALEEKE